MALRPRRLTPHTFDDIVSAMPFALVHLGSGRLGFQRGLAEFFDNAYPDRFSFGTLSRNDVRDAGWLDHSFRSAMGSLRGGVVDGYYLFGAGVVIGHHRGVVRPSNVSYIAEPGAQAQLERVRRLAFGPAQVREADVEAARQIIVYFDEIVARKQGPSEWRDDPGPSHAPPPGRPPPGAPPPARPTPRAAPGDPFVVLGLTADADDAAVRSAYREQMKLNHPDKVSHLSPALQAFAETQVLAIKAAYDAIRAMRRR